MLVVQQILSAAVAEFLCGKKAGYQQMTHVPGKKAKNWISFEFTCTAISHYRPSTFLHCSTTYNTAFDNLIPITFRFGL